MDRKRKRIRKFNGLNFRGVGSFKTKEKANQRKEFYKRKGSKVRIVKSKNPLRYHLYVRN
jgi:hypothetical protein